jgi:uncharacterized protein YqjF (DUF2071 family)
MARWPFHSEIVVDSGPSGCKVGLGDAKKEIPDYIELVEVVVNGTKSVLIPKCVAVHLL